MAASPNNSATIKIFDDENTTPIISIAAENGSVTESGTDSKFVFYATGLSSSRNMNVFAIASEDGGDFIKNFLEGESSYLIAFSDSDGDGVYQGESIINSLIQTDGIAEPDARIKLTLQSHSSYRLGTNTVGIMRAFDDDSLPTVSMVADNGGFPENKSSGVEFELTATGLTQDTSLVIKAIISEEGNNFIQNSFKDFAITDTVSFTDSDGDNIYTGNTSVVNYLHNDNTREMDGTIKLTLTSNSSVYRIGSNSVGRLIIYDDDSAPTISIASENGKVSENATTGLRFNLTMTGVNAASLVWPIRASLTEDGGDFILDSFQGTTVSYQVNFADSDNDNIYYWTTCDTTE